MRPRRPPASGDRARCIRTKRQINASYQVIPVLVRMPRRCTAGAAAYRRQQVTRGSRGHGIPRAEPARKRERRSFARAFATLPSRMGKLREPGVISV